MNQQAERLPLRIKVGMFILCTAGQHGGCPAVGDPYEENTQISREHWVCLCDCHGLLTAALGA